MAPDPTVTNIKGDLLVDNKAAALHLTNIGIPCTPGQIRIWAFRGLIQRHGHDKRGRTLYDLDELIRRARATQVDAHPDRV